MTKYRLHAIALELSHRVVSLNQHISRYSLVVSPYHLVSVQMSSDVFRCDLCATLICLSIFEALSKLSRRCICPYLPIHKLLNYMNNVLIICHLLIFFFANKLMIIVCLFRYFSESATQEMLDEWRPLLCPFDVTMQRAISYFELFLPTTLPPELHHKGFK